MRRSTAAFLGLTAPRWWIRNARTQQVLGSVYAQSEDEALGKAIVKFGLSGWQADKYTAHKGGTDA